MSDLAWERDRPPQEGNQEGREQAPGWLVRSLPWLLIGGLVLFHALSNWLWLSENVTLTGWDKPRHLAQSLNYARMLSETGSTSPLSVRTLFTVMVSDPIRPPLFPASAVVMYWLFGWSSDVATMVNIAYMAIMLAATYGIGRRWGGRRLGLVAVVLLAFFPMFYAMSRYFYIEFALTAMVALTVYLLLATDGFRRRGFALLFGLSLGLGLLTKRTFAVFVVGPVLVAVLYSGLLPSLWQRLHQRPKLYWKRALLALVAGFALAALWYFPNQAAVRELILGDALLLIWWVLAALAIYFVSLASAPLSNALSAFFLAAALASTWYLARVEFLQRMALYGYGVNDPRGRALRLDSLTTYLYYLRKLGNEHLSLVLFGLLVVVTIAAAVIFVRRQGSVRKALRQVQPEGWIVLAWAGGAYVLLTFSIYQETRAFTPVLPAMALIFGAVLLKLPWRPVRLGILALVLAFGLTQFSALSFEPIHRLLPSNAFRLPIWGETSLLAQGSYIELPDEGGTDRGYWIQPDILRRMENRRQELGLESQSLGLLARTRQLNAGAFIYLMLADYPQLRMESLVEGFEEGRSYQPIFAHDYLAVKKDNVGVGPAQTDMIDDIIAGAWPLFAQTYELETTYPLPDGDTVYLYRKVSYLPADYPMDYVTGLAEDLGQRTRAGDAILVTPTELLGPLVSRYAGPARVYLAPTSEEELVEIATEHPRLFLVLGDPNAGEVQSLAQTWLNQHGFPAAHEWAGSLQLLTYGTVAGLPVHDTTVEVRATAGQGIDLVGYHLPASSWTEGDIVPLTLVWQRGAAIEEDYNVFVHLLDGSGKLVAQTDSAPVGGLRPTSSWQENEIITDRHGLLVPEGLAPGQYQIYVGVYLPMTGERLPVSDAAGQPLGDSFPLGQVVVAP